VAHSGRQRHRDRDRDSQQRRDPLSIDERDAPSANRLFRITDAERRKIAKCLEHIDDARRALESQQSRHNREIIRELRASADAIFDLLNDLEEIDS
jgi:hypothetical protein